jgi:hypothetical protein
MGKKLTQNQVGVEEQMEKNGDVLGMLILILSTVTVI